MKNAYMPHTALCINGMLLSLGWSLCHLSVANQQAHSEKQSQKCLCYWSSLCVVQPYSVMLVNSKCVLRARPLHDIERANTHPDLLIAPDRICFMGNHHVNSHHMHTGLSSHHMHIGLSRHRMHTGLQVGECGHIHL